MAVDDHGLEVLKKSGEQVTPGDKTDYFLKVKDAYSLETLEILEIIQGDLVNINDNILAFQPYVDSIVTHLFNIDNYLNNIDTNVTTIRAVVENIFAFLESTIDEDGNSHAEVHGNMPDGTDVVLRLSELGAPNSDGFYDVADNTKPASVGVIAHTRGPSAAETDQIKRLSAIEGENDATCLDVALHHSDGNEIDEAAPLYVSLTENPGDVGTVENPIFVSNLADVLNPPDIFNARLSKVIATNGIATQTTTLVADISLTDFVFGGRGTGQCSLFSSDLAATQLAPNGGFNSSSDVSAWTNASAGSSALLSWAYSTAQMTEGTGSAAMTFTQSDSNNFPAIKYTYGSPQDFTVWRYIEADVRVTVAAGGAQSRRVQIILTDINAATRIYEIVGTTTTAPFSTEQWLTITGEIENPNSQTGTFDVYNVSSITLKLLDGGNKAGTIYWDNVHFEVSRSLLERIYIEANRTFGLSFTTPIVLNAGETLSGEIKNNSASSAEFSASIKGVFR